MHVLLAFNPSGVYSNKYNAINKFRLIFAANPTMSGWGEESNSKTEIKILNSIKTMEAAILNI